MFHLQKILWNKYKGCAHLEQKSKIRCYRCEVMQVGQTICLQPSLPVLEKLMMNGVFL